MDSLPNTFMYTESLHHWSVNWVQPADANTNIGSAQTNLMRILKRRNKICTTTTSGKLSNHYNFFSACSTQDSYATMVGENLNEGYFEQIALSVTGQGIKGPVSKNVMVSRGFRSATR